MTLLEFIIGGLVTYRLSLMFSKENGPGRIFKKLRNAPPPKSSAREGLSCLHCGSIWWGVPVALFFTITKRITWTDTTPYWLAFSAVAIILHHQFTEDFKK